MSLTQPTLDLSGQFALVTGAARGLGRAEALALATRGAQVAITDVRDLGDTSELLAAAGRDALAVPIDLADPGSPQHVVEYTIAHFGSLDIVVNNAGLVRDRMSFNLEDRDWDAVVAVNLTASFRVARACARHWRARRDAPRPRAMINTTSESGLYGNVGQAAYAAAKAGVVALTLTLAGELHGLGVRVNAIAPRARTPMSFDAFGDLPARGTFDPFAPDHVAAVVGWLASPAAADVTGQVLVVHGTEVQLLEGWRPMRAVTCDEGWDDRRLAGLRNELFGGHESTHLPRPVADLFTLPTQETRT